MNAQLIRASDDARRQKVQPCQKIGRDFEGLAGGDVDGLERSLENLLKLADMGERQRRGENVLAGRRSSNAGMNEGTASLV